MYANVHMYCHLLVCQALLKEDLAQLDQLPLGLLEQLELAFVVFPFAELADAYQLQVSYI